LDSGAPRPKAISCSDICTNTKNRSALSAMSLPPLEDLVACHQCDTLHAARTIGNRHIATCVRCHATLQSSRPTALVSVLALASTAFILMIAAISFPFLDPDIQGNYNATSVIGAILAFNTGRGVPLAIAVAFFIIILPLMRLYAIIYAIGPLARGVEPRKYARQMFGLAETLRPWSMAEIFALGCAVALVKLSALAEVLFGPAAWLFAILVVLVVASDSLMCRYSIWTSLKD